MSILTAGRLVTPEQVLSPAWLEIEDETIVALGQGPPPRPADLDGPYLLAVPGFVDMHVHGGGGQSFTAQSRDEVMTAVTHHRSHGTTTSVASLVTAELSTLRESLSPHGVLARVVAAGELAGIHLEGPWLSPSRAGAHDRRLLRPPEPHELQDLLDTCSGLVRMVTLAPELAGGLEAVRRVVAAGVVAAIGHTDADHSTACAAIDAGATVATHLFNAMPPVHHRAPGPVVALMDDPRVTVELIADGVHLDPAVLGHVARAVGASRVALVTDAMAAAGSPDGRYALGGLAVDVVNRVARRADNGAIAGGTAGMDDLFRAAVARGGSRPDDAGHGDSARFADVAGLPDHRLLDAARMTSTTPAAALGLGSVGRLAVGARADIVLLDAALLVHAVMRRGRWI